MTKRKNSRSRVGFIIVLAMLLVAGTAIGCGSDDDGDGSNGSDGAAAAEEDLTFGFVVPVLANPYWQANAEFGEQIANDLGINIEVVDPREEEERQVKLTEDLVARGVDGLILAPITESVAPALLQIAEGAQLPVVFNGRGPGFDPEEYDGDVYEGAVTVNAESIGRLEGDTLYEAGCRRLVGLAGLQGNSFADAVVSGFESSIEEKDDAEILQLERGAELRQDGVSATESFLSAFPGPDFDCVWGFNDETALGAVRALKNAGVIDEVSVSGFDATAEALDAVRAGEMLFTLGGIELQGGYAVAMLYDVLNGTELNPEVVAIDGVVVDEGNVDAYGEQYVDNPPPISASDLSLTENPDAGPDRFEVVID